MFITGLGIASPLGRYTQRECWEALKQSKQFAAMSTRSRALMKKVLSGNNGIATRHLALESLTEAFDVTPDILHARFLRHAPTLAAQAAQQAIADAGSSPADRDAN